MKPIMPAALFAVVLLSGCSRPTLPVAAAPHPTPVAAAPAVQPPLIFAPPPVAAPPPQMQNVQARAEAAEAERGHVSERSPRRAAPLPPPAFSPQDDRRADMAARSAVMGTQRDPPRDHIHITDRTDVSVSVTTGGE